MADFSPPFASVGGVNRAPTTDEQSDGFACGDADLTLFNRMFGRVEAELKAVQDAGGIAGTEVDDTTVLQAINALISAATGGTPAGYILMTQAVARLPIFPEVTTNSGVIAVTSPSTGTVRVPVSAAITHRGIQTYTTAQTDMTTTLSKTYHLRWQVSAGVGTFVLKDLADTGYNPTVAAETNSAFDSTYDDMLVARIVTNSSNVATITNLVNKNKLSLTVLESLSTTRTTNSNGEFLHVFTTRALNWARTPAPTGLVAASAGRFTGVGAGGPTLSLSGSLTDGSGTVAASNDRYAIKPVANEDTDIASSSLSLSSQLMLIAEA